MHPAIIYLIGNSTRDKIITSHGEAETIGGTVWYAAQLLARLMPQEAINVVGHGDALVKRHFEEQNVDVRYVKIDGRIAHFENNYTGALRRQHARMGVRLEMSDIPPEAFDAEALLVGPLLQDIDLSILAAKRKGYLLLDVQGLLRHITPANQVIERMGPDAAMAIQHCDILKLNAREAQIITSTNHVDTALKNLYRMGPNLIVITQGSKGAHIYDGERLIHLSTPEVPVVDSTGAGDIFAAAFLRQYLDSLDPVIAGQSAVIAAALSTRGFGASAIPSQQEIGEWRDHHFFSPNSTNIRHQSST
jgi:sugar/nucleoside kinase (ribokinase family)